MKNRALLWAVIACGCLNAPKFESADTGPENDQNNANNTELDVGESDGNARDTTPPDSDTGAPATPIILTTAHEGLNNDTRTSGVIDGSLEPHTLPFFSFTTDGSNSQVDQWSVLIENSAATLRFVRADPAAALDGHSARLQFNPDFVQVAFFSERLPEAMAQITSDLSPASDDLFYIFTTGTNCNDGRSTLSSAFTRLHTMIGLVPMFRRTSAGILPCEEVAGTYIVQSMATSPVFQTSHFEAEMSSDQIRVEFDLGTRVFDFDRTSLFYSYNVLSGTGSSPAISFMTCGYNAGLDVIECLRSQSQNQLRVSIQIVEWAEATVRTTHDLYNIPAGTGNVSLPADQELIANGAWFSGLNGRNAVAKCDHATALGASAECAIEIAVSEINGTAELIRNANASTAEIYIQYLGNITE